MLTLFDARIRNSDIEVVRKLGHIPPVLANDGEIRQVLANLIGNAIDAMPAGGNLCLRTATSKDWQDGRKGICITVADTGQGMDRHTQQRIFEPFFSTKGLTGTGLGLWVTQGILAKHQAKVTLRSRQGQHSGTTFRIFLPRHIITDEEKATLERLSQMKKNLVQRREGPGPKKENGEKSGDEKKPDDKK